MNWILIFFRQKFPYLTLFYRADKKYVVSIELKLMLKLIKIYPSFQLFLKVNYLIAFSIGFGLCGLQKFVWIGS